VKAVAVLLHQPPNVHRAVARLTLHLNHIASAQLLNVTACKPVVPH
jgi:hypothetical protein